MTTRTRKAKRKHAAIYERHLCVRLRTEDADALRQAAQDAGCTMAEYVRILLAQDRARQTGKEEGWYEHFQPQT